MNQTTSAEAFRTWLYERESAPATIERYMRDLRRFEAFQEEFQKNREKDAAGTAGEGTAGVGTVPGPAPDRETVLAYKAQLGETMALSSANSMLASLNAYLRFIGREDLCVHRFRQQRDTITFFEQELTREELQRLLKAAVRKGDYRLALGIFTLAGSGARVSELRFFTVESVRQGVVEIRLKGKTRRIPVAEVLQERILHYCDVYGIRSGPVFITGNGRLLDRSNFWRSLHGLAEAADVDPAKLHPHNLRHFFARSYYKQTRDLTGLADLLGHSSINVTRIYTAENGNCYKKTLENMCESVLPVRREEKECDEMTTKKQHNVSYVVQSVPILLGFESNVTISFHMRFCNMLRKYFSKTISPRFCRAIS